jgi:hypothetical protein
VTAPGREPAQVAEGDTVVMQDGNHARRMSHRNGTVIKVARVWITVRPEGATRDSGDRRYRLDTQTDGGDRAFAGRFYTLDQWAERERRNAADAFLREQGIDVRRDGPWWRREVELADIIRAALTTQEGS